MPTSAERQTYLQLFYSSCLVITNTKGKDYDPDDIALMDTLRHAVDADIEVPQVLWIYYGKHTSAIRRYVRTGRVESEPILERFKDAANYIALLAFYESHKRELHAAWRQHWLTQTCESEPNVDSPFSPADHSQNCQRCETLSWLEKRAFAIGSATDSSPSTPKARG